MAAGYPSANNTYVPSHEATGNLIVGFSRNPKKFKLNQYTKLVPVSKGGGYFLSITPEEAARVINTNLSDFVWHDGQEAPQGNTNTESFVYTKYLTDRYSFPFTLGNKTVDQADWPILSVHAGIAAAKAMTARTVNVVNTLTTTGNWSGQTDTATNLGGGKWDVSGATDKFIRKTFNQVSENILQASLGVVQRSDIICVINPNTARLMAETEELRDYLKQSPFAMGQVQGDKAGESSNDTWGLPDQLFGIKIVVEDAVKVTSKKLATSATKAYALPNSYAIFTSRPGGLVGIEGVADFSTCHLFMYEEMTVESFNDVNNRRTTGRVTDDYTPALVAPASGYLVTSATH